MKTRDEIILDAFRLFGGVGDFETINAAQTTAGVNALKSVINTLNTNGYSLWKNKQYSLIPPTTFPAAIGPGQTFNTTANPTKLVSAQRYDTLAQTTISLSIYTRAEYTAITSVNIVGTPIAIYFNPKLTHAEFYLWPTPDAYWTTNGRILLDVTEQLSVPSNGTATLDFPDWWEEAITFMLAARLAPQYGVPLQDRQVLESTAKQLMEAALSYSNEEGSVFFSPMQTWNK